MNEFNFESAFFSIDINEMVSVIQTIKNTKKKLTNELISIILSQK